MNKILRISFTLLKIAAGVTLLVISVRNVDWNELEASLRNAHLSWLIAAQLSVLVGLGLKSGRWWVLLKNFDAPLSYRKVTEAYLAGQAANIALPMRGGEIVRLGITSVEKSDRAGQIAVTIALEKFLDLVALAVCAAWVSAYIPIEKSAWVHGKLLPASGGALALLFAAIFCGPGFWERIRRQIPWQGIPWVAKCIRFTDRLVQSALWLKDLRRVSGTIFATVLIWITMVSTNLLLFRGLNMTVNFTAGWLVLVMVYLGIMPALLPGNIGSFYFFAQAALIPFGYETNVSALYAMLLHAMVTLPPLALGGIFLLASWWNGKNGKQVKQQVKSQ